MNLTGHLAMNLITYVFNLLLNLHRLNEPSQTEVLWNYWYFVSESCY